MKVLGKNETFGIPSQITSVVIVIILFPIIQFSCSDNRQSTVDDNKMYSWRRILLELKTDITETMMKMTENYKSS